MNRFEKVLAVLLALSSIGGGVGLTANAESSKNAEMLTQVEELVQNGEISEDEYAFLSRRLEEVNNTRTTYYIPAYSTYVTGAISPTTHYLAPIVPSETPLDEGSVCFYLNLNILSTDATASSRLKLGRNYISGGYTLGDISMNENFPLAKTILVPFTPSVPVNATSYGELFTYKLGVFNSTLVSSEKMLNRYTNWNPQIIDPNLTLSTTAPTGYTAQKCVYSVGDLDRDGDVDDTDADYLINYLVGNTVPNPSSSSSGYDIVAFELAGDCDSDGDVDMIDVLKLNQYNQNLISMLPTT